MEREEYVNENVREPAANKQNVIYLHIAVMLFGLARVVAQFVDVYKRQLRMWAIKEFS